MVENMDNFKIVINRQSDSKVQTTGKLSLFNNERIVFRCFTLELGWHNNAKNKSCIPAGIYDCKKVNKSKSFRYTHFDILNVPGRSGIKIHAGNFYHEIRGCILVGDKLSDINADGLQDIINSKLTLKTLCSIIPDNVGIFKLEITNDGT